MIDIITVSTMTTQAIASKLVRCRSYNNLSLAALNGTADTTSNCTESCERISKRRRMISPPCSNSVSITASSVVSNNLATIALKNMNNNQPTYSRKISSYELVAEKYEALHTFEDSYNAICAIESDSYDCFPTIEWNFDDNDDNDTATYVESEEDQDDYDVSDIPLFVGQATQSLQRKHKTQ